jgi:hypothetical protein
MPRKCCSRRIRVIIERVNDGYRASPRFTSGRKDPVHVALDAQLDCLSHRRPDLSLSLEHPICPVPKHFISTGVNDLISNARHDLISHSHAHPSNINQLLSLYQAIIYLLYSTFPKWGACWNTTISRGTAIHAGTRRRASPATPPWSCCGFSS